MSCHEQKDWICKFLCHVLSLYISKWRFNKNALTHFQRIKLHYCFVYCCHVSDVIWWVFFLHLWSWMKWIMRMVWVKWFYYYDLFFSILKWYEPIHTMKDWVEFVESNLHNKRQTLKPNTNNTMYKMHSLMKRIGNSNIHTDTRTHSFNFAILSTF